jgi:PAS domain-containing protein
MALQKTGESTTEEYRVVWPDGTSRWVQEKVLASRGTAERGAIRLDGILTDVSERKRTERMLSDADGRLHAFLNHDPVMAFIKDADGRYFFVNEPFLRFLKKPAEEVLQKKDDEVFSSDLAHKMSKHEARVLANGQATQATEKVMGPLGVPHTWFITRFPFRDGCGRRFLGALIVDVYELKRMIAQS